MQSKYSREYRSQCWCSPDVKCDWIKYKDNIKQLKHRIIDDFTGEIYFYHSWSSYQYQKMILNACPSIDCYDRLKRSNKRRSKSVRDRVANIVLSNDAVFLTLTFRDSVFESTTPQTRRKYVERFLKENCFNYVANIDYGENNGREHYHAICDKRIKGDKWRAICGSINFEKIRPHARDLVKTSKYIAKISNHALKSTTTPFNTKIIYSRSN